MDAKYVTEPKLAFASLSVLMILGGLYQEKWAEASFLVALASMAGFILIPSSSRERHTLWCFIFKVHIQTLVLPFLLLCTVIGMSKGFQNPVSDTGAAFVKLSLTIWVCLQWLVLLPLALRPAIEKWVESQRGERVLKIVVIDDWVRILFDILWVVFVFALYLLTR
ncbi:hypothetical protein HYQ43_16620 [Paracoccus pantotrophus]|uniref:Uncharacterized protein n=2 Tax=Paracoccus TaxID=265 RepID=A0A7H9BX65_PARPN|nr:hypothetical protein [Paracoccus pantotrophus]QLH15773.1 hypothetical protein HYQ43_16620 [Paracoccus pantotrophus]